MSHSKLSFAILPSLVLCAALLGGCGSAAPAAASALPEQTAAPTSAPISTSTPMPEPTEDPAARVATAADMTTVEEVGDPDMVPVPASALKDGSYSVEMESSSSMFRIAACELSVADGKMTAVMTMGGTAYPWLYMGAALEAAAADESALIPYVENAEGAHTFTIPVASLNSGFACAAFSKNKELWYDRTLLVRADSLPLDAFVEGFLTTPESLKLTPGAYTAEVTLTGGSGKAAITSPARLTVTEEGCTARIEWHSPNYDYMKVDGTQYLPVNSDGNSVFEIPVRVFDMPFSVIADTVAMSTPHEISYQICFDSASLKAAAE